MKRNRLIMRICILLILAAGAGIAVFQTLNNDQKTLQAGAVAPDFQLQTLQGETIRLSDLRGKGVLLNFWGYWCEPCEKEMPHIEKVYQELEGVDIAIIAVHVRDANIPVKRFIEKYDLHFPILIDKDKEVMRLYRIDPLPTTFFIGPDGMIKKRIIGGPMPVETIRRNLQAVSP